MRFQRERETPNAGVLAFPDIGSNLDDCFFRWRRHKAEWSTRHDDVYRRLPSARERGAGEKATTHVQQFHTDRSSNLNWWMTSSVCVLLPPEIHSTDQCDDHEDGEMDVLGSCRLSGDHTDLPDGLVPTRVRGWLLL